MMICRRCGRTCCEEDAFSRSLIYDNTEIGRIPIAEAFDLKGCESCGGELEEAKECTVCGAFIDTEGLDVCDVCLERGETADNAYEIGERNREGVKLNGFLAALGEERIRTVLLEYISALPEDERGRLIKDYLYDDDVYFAEFLTEREGERCAV